ncbi:LytR C-terminal domain-containing protein [Streptomyces sp. NPDC055078]
MNDQQNPYDPYYQQPQIIGYDEYGQPVYQQPQPYEQPQQYDPYAQQAQHPEQPPPGQAYGYDPYDQPPAQPEQPQSEQPQPYDRPQSYEQPSPYDQYGRPQSYDPYAELSQQPPYPQQQGGQDSQGYGYGYEPEGGFGQDTGRQPAAVDTAQWSIPQQQPAPGERLAPGPTPPDTSDAPDTATAQGPEADLPLPGPRRSEDGRDYRTEQFSFIEEPDDDSEDVIDWLKFTESRSERREEAKRRGRNRVVALVVVLAIALVSGVGYLWFTGALSGSDSDKTGTAAAGAQKRDVIVVHLHNTKKKGTSTALLVDNVTTKQGTTVLLPNSLSVAQDDGTPTTLGKSVEEDGSVGTREAVGTLLGAKITGTWRLDTPFLENLVELVGTIDLTTDATVPGAKKGEAPLVKRGENQTLNGRAAVAYATHLGPGEAETMQLQRFGQVMQAVLKKFPSDAKSATVTVETLAQILDPSLTEKDLGASLAKLADHAKGGDYRTAVLPVQQDGTLTAQASRSVVKDILGGSVSAPEKDAAVRVGVKNATGKSAAAETARVSLVNGGYVVVDGGKSDTAPTSKITYGDDARKAEAAEVAKTLGLPTSAVRKAAAAPNADISVVLGEDFSTG